VEQQLPVFTVQQFILNMQEHQHYSTQWHSITIHVTVAAHVDNDKYEGNSISTLQIQVATYVFELSAGICHR